MDKIFLVIGYWSDYDSSDTWPVCYYLDEDKAKEHVHLANLEEALLDAVYKRREAVRWAYLDGKERDRSGRLRVMTDEENQEFYSLPDPRKLHNKYDAEDTRVQGEGTQFSYVEVPYGMVE